MSEWIDASVEKPKAGVPVDGAHWQRSHVIVQWDAVDKLWVCGNRFSGFYTENAITHWRELPELPEVNT